MRDSQPPPEQRRASLGLVVLLLAGLVGLTTGPIPVAARGASALTERPATSGAEGTPDPKTGTTGVTGTSFSNAELGFSVSWEEGVWAAQRDHVPTDGALAGVMLINTAGGLLYIDAIPAGDLRDAAGCVASNQTLIEGFERVAGVAPLKDEDGAAMGNVDGDPAYVISTMEIDGDPAYLYVGCANIDGGDAFLAFTYYLTQGEDLDDEAFVSGWLPDVQAVVDSLEVV